MRDRRARIVLFSFLTAGSCLVALLTMLDDPSPAELLGPVLMVLAYSSGLIRDIRNRPLPALDLDRVRVLRLQNAAGAVVAAVACGVLVAVWRSSGDPARSSYLVVGLGAGAMVIVLMWTVARLARVQRRGEIPVKMRRRHEMLARRRSG